MSEQPPTSDAPLDPDGDPENLASKSGGSGDLAASEGVDGVREATSVQDDPNDDDDPDADPEMLSSTS